MMIVGPVLIHQGGYAFDTWTRTQGRRSGFAYRRIEDAYYARNSEIAGEARNGGIGAVICNTLADFVAEIADNNTALNAGWAMAAE